MASKKQSAYKVSENDALRDATAEETEIIDAIRQDAADRGQISLPE